ncbi:MAG: hypothetical protein JKX98_07470, partial [Alcanivoracaceae bacterium]|nr:hypothetical protein [Alcanivoracaceae bacterium]
SELTSSKKSLSSLCQKIEINTLARTLKNAKKSQIQLTCEGFTYLGKDRVLKIIFSDNKLDKVQIFNIRNVLPDLKNKLKTVYGEPTINTRWLDYFENAGISLHVLDEKIAFVSERIKKQYKEDLIATKNNSITLSLSRKQWQQDLNVLDHYIRNKHINPFYHNSEKGYLQLFYQAHDYIKNTSTPDNNIINGYIDKLVAYTGDGHSFVVGRTKRYGEYSFFIDYFDEDLHIISIDEKNIHLLGAKILAFDSTSVIEAKKLIRPFSPFVNTSSIKRESIYLYRHPGLLFAAGISESAKQVELTLQLINGDRVTQTFYNNTQKEIKWRRLQENDWANIPLHRQKAAKRQWLRYLPESHSLYLHYGSVVEKEKGDIRNLSHALIKAIDKHQAQRLIIDIRHNPGGDSFHNAVLINAISKLKKINQRGKLFILTSRNTFSAAINFAGHMEMRTKAIFIGEKVGDTSSFTGESGSQASFKLPHSSIVANLSFSEWNSTFDYDQRDAVGLDMPIAMSFTDFITGQDPVLQAALDYQMPEMKTIKLNRAQEYKWLGRYDYSPDKVLKIFKQGKQLKMEITEWVFSDLYPIGDGEMLTDIRGLSLKKMADGRLSLIQQGQVILELKRLEKDHLKPLELLIAGQFSLAMKSYQELHRQNPQLLSIRGNSLGILASHLRVRHNAAKLYEQLREIAVEIYGEPIVSWDVDDIGI